MATQTAKNTKTDAEGKPTRVAKDKSKLKGTDPREFIKPFAEDYGKHLERANEAAEMTGTPAWRSNYEAQMHEHRVCIDNQSKIIVEA